jgi:hypothetical protein
MSKRNSDNLEMSVHSIEHFLFGEAETANDALRYVAGEADAI